MEVTIEKLVFGGQALAHSNGKVVFVWGALPGETVTVRVIRNKKDYIESVVDRVVQAAPERIAPAEDHYLSCSPWQVLSPQAEAHWKLQLGRAAYYHWRDHYDLRQLTLVNNLDQQFGYRNKIEYSFWQQTDQLDLAFFGRGSHRRQPIKPCCLADPAINQTAEAVLQWLRQAGVTGFHLKSLIILSTELGRTSAGLFLKDKIPLTTYPQLSDALIGFQLYYSNPKCPAAVPTELLYQAGTTDLTSTVLGTPLRHSPLGFFQVNVPIFEQAIQNIATWLDPTKPVIDYYSGVGSISLPLAQYYSSACLVENNAAAAALAQRNIEELGLIGRCQAVCLAAEAMLDTITSEHIVIVDPPRAGLHDAVVARFLQIKPWRIVYLSCNLSTQARDVQKLLSQYHIVHVRLYNFFPRTPHLEGLCILERNTS
jgi:23S rRNA (uracil1939-C5)-methyltransferase